MTLKHIAAAALLSAITIGGAIGALASSPSSVSLFKIVTVKDEIVIGLKADELQTMSRAGEEEVASVARTLADSAPLTVWQYAVRKGSDGSLEQAPIKRVSLLPHESLRVEPYETPLRIVDEN